MEERWHLSDKEYYALRQMFGFAGQLQAVEPFMEKRLRKIPGGWRDWRLLEAVSEKLLGEITRTIPLNKLQMIMRELKMTQVRVEVRRVTDQSNTDVGTYVSQEALDRIAQKAADAECFACEKRGADARNCQLRKDFEDLVHYGFPKVQNKQPCHFAGAVIGGYLDDDQSGEAYGDLPEIE